MIAAVQVGAVKLYVAAVEAAQEKRKTGWNSEKPSILIDAVLSFTLSFFLVYIFCRFFLNLTLFMTKLRVLVLSFPDFTDNSND